MKVNILGTEYDVKMENEAIAHEDCDGICRVYTKQISIRPLDAMLQKDDTDEDKEKRWREVVRHEIIHAFLFECGMEKLCSNEEVVEWIAKQFPKMRAIFHELGCEV